MSSREVYSRNVPSTAPASEAQEPSVQATQVRQREGLARHIVGAVRLMRGCSQEGENCVPELTCGSCNLAASLRALPWRDPGLQGARVRFTVVPSMVEVGRLTRLTVQTATLHPQLGQVRHRDEGQDLSRERKVLVLPEAEPHEAIPGQTEEIGDAAEPGPRHLRPVRDRR